MAIQSTLEILIRAKNDAAVALTKLNADLKKVQESQAQVGRGNKSLNDLGSGARNAAGGVKELGTNLTQMANGLPALVTGVRAFVAGFLALEAVSKARGLADQAARTQVLGTVLNIVGKNAGYTRDELEGMDKQVQSLGITAASSREALTKFLQSGLDATKAAELARAAQDLAVVSGQNSSETFRRLILNIQQMDTVGLKWMGITLDMAEAEEIFRQKVGGVTGELTRQQKQSSFLLGVLEKSKSLSGAYEEAMGDVGKQTQSLSRYTEELAVSVGNFLLPAYLAIVEEFTLFLKNAKLASDEMVNGAGAAEAFGKAVGAVAKNIREAAEWFLEHKETIATVIKLWLEFKVVTFAVSKTWGIISTAATVFRANLVGLIASLGGVVTGLLAVASPVTLVVGAITAIVGALTLFQDNVSVMNGTLRDLYQFIIGDLVAGWVRLKTAVLGTSDTIETFLAKLTTFDQAQKDLIDKQFQAREKARQKELDDALALRQDSLDALTIGSGEGKEREAAERRLHDLYLKRADLNRQQLEAERDLLKSKNGENNLTLETAREKLKAVKDEGKAIDKQIAGEQAVTNEVKERLKAKADEEARTNEVKKKLEEQAKILRQAREDAKLTDKDGNASFKIVDGDQLSLEFNKVRMAFKTLTDDYRKTADEVGGVNVTMQNDLLSLVRTLAEAAKSPEEMTQAIRSLTEVSRQFPEVADEAFAQIQNLRFDRAQAALKDLENQARAFVDGSKTTFALVKSLQELANSDTQVNTQFTNTARDLGATFASLQRGVIDLSERLEIFKDRTAALGKAAAEALMQSFNQLRTAYQRDLAEFTLNEQKKQDVLQQTVASEDTLLASNEALDRESTARRLELAQKYYLDLNALRSQALDKFREFAEQVKAMDQEIYATQKQAQQDINDLRRQGMTEEQAYKDKERELYAVTAQAQQAFQEKNYDLAKDLTRRRIELTKELAQADKTVSPQEVSKVADAYNDLTTIQKTQRGEAEQAAQDQLKVYQNLTQEVNKLGEQIKDLAGKQVVNLQVSIDDPSLQSMLAKLKDALKQAKFQIDVEANVRSSGPGFAAGGHIRGPGTSTSDSILAFLSNGEYVLRADAVKRYGVDFLDALNQGLTPRLPRYAQGGGVNLSATQAQRDVVDVNLNFGGETYRLASDRQEARRLTKALTSVRRGSV